MTIYDEGNRERTERKSYHALSRKSTYSQLHEEKYYIYFENNILLDNTDGMGLLHKVRNYFWSCNVER